MKKIGIITFAIFMLKLTPATFSQIFEIKSGVNLSTMLSKSDFDKPSDDYKLSPRLLIGVATEFPLTELFSVESGILFSSKGYKLDLMSSLYEDSNPIHIYNKTILNYIEIPVSLKTTKLIANIPFYATIGSYISVGLNGKKIVNELSGGITERKEYEVKMSNSSDWDKIDYGLIAGLGIQIKRFVLGLNYSFGLANISNDSSSFNYIKKNRVWGLTLGYKINLEKTSP